MDTSVPPVTAFLPQRLLNSILTVPASVAVGMYAACLTSSASVHQLFVFLHAWIDCRQLISAENEQRVWRLLDGLREEIQLSILLQDSPIAQSPHYNAAFIPLKMQLVELLTKQLLGGSETAAHQVLASVSSLFSPDQNLFSTILTPRAADGDRSDLWMVEQPYPDWSSSYPNLSKRPASSVPRLQRDDSAGQTPLVSSMLDQRKVQQRHHENIQLRQHALSVSLALRDCVRPAFVASTQSTTDTLSSSMRSDGSQVMAQQGRRSRLMSNLGESDQPSSSRVRFL